MNKFIKAFIFTLFLTLTFFSYSVNAGWIKNGDNWSYKENGNIINSGFKKIDNEWYYFENQIMKTGWVFDNNNWYYLKKDGSMKTGWLFDDNNWYYLNKDGSMKKGWIKWSGDWYFLSHKGQMQKSIIEVEGVKYDMGTDGKMKLTTPIGYPYHAYTKDGKETEMTLPKKNGQTVTLNLWEGMNLQMMAKRLNDNGVCRYEDFLSAVNEKHPDFKFESMVKDDTFYRYEGYLFPDIYEFYMYESAETVVNKMLKNFEKRVTDELILKIENLKLTLHEVLTLASIVQGEAPDSYNMKKVAKVFLNRLDNSKVFPKLQANPTSNYANDVILLTNPQMKTLAEEYDSYKTDGLIKGPINCPGIMAIEAVLNPDNSCEDYFFCTDKITKEFYYAKTWEEHKKNTVKAGLSKEE